MTKLLIALYWFFWSLGLSAQAWDILILEKEDTTLAGRQVLELASGDLLLPVENWFFNPNSVGVYISGFPQYGFDLIRVNKRHQLDTSLFVTLAPKFVIGSLSHFDDSVIVPVELYTGFEPCISPSPYAQAASQATDLGLIRLGSNASLYLQDTVHLHRDSSLCGHLDIVQFANCHDKLRALRHSPNGSKLMLETIDPYSFEILHTQYIDAPSVPSVAYFECEDNMILLYCRNDQRLCKMDYEGNILWSSEEIASAVEIEVSQDKEYYWIRSHAYGEGVQTYIYKFDRLGNLITTFAFEDMLVRDIEPIGDGMIMALENGNSEVKLHIVNARGRIINTESFYYERLLGKYIELLSTGEVLMVADKIDAFNLGVCCIELGDNTPNKVLILKKPLQEIWNPEILEEAIVEVSPNPAESEFELIFRDHVPQSNENLSYILHSISGQEMMRDQIQGPSQFVSIVHLPAAIYLLSIYDDEALVSTQKVVKY